jgi:hypothetical protein
MFHVAQYFSIFKDIMQYLFRALDRVRILLTSINPEKKKDFSREAIYREISGSGRTSECAIWRRRAAVRACVRPESEMWREQKQRWGHSSSLV